MFTTRRILLKHSLLPTAAASDARSKQPTGKLARSAAPRPLHPRADEIEKAMRREAIWLITTHDDEITS
jgi:hypothetical protein